MLIVEDDPDSREFLCTLLEMAGAAVLCVESVAQAMDGVYHSFDPVILSWRSEDRWRAQALEAGAADVLTKPLDAALLIARVLAAVESMQLPGEQGSSRPASPSAPPPTP